MALALGAEEGRVLGALIEKQLTTPQQYPLTLNSLLAACNQTSSRDPVVSYDERLVSSTLAGLKEKGLLRFVYPSHGRSATRYRQVLEEVLHLQTEELALMAVLLLRGPQTPGELRGRTERMAQFASIDEVERLLETLAARDEPLVVRLPRQLGRKEMRYAQVLAGEPARDPAPAGEPARDPAPAAPSPGAPAAPSPLASAPAWSGAPAPDPTVLAAGPSLADEVAALRAEVADLRRDLETLRLQLGG